MKTRIISILTLLVTGLYFMVLAGEQPVCADIGNIDVQEKFAWAENAGWINFRPAQAGVVIHTDHLYGYAWAENIGYVHLGVDTEGSMDPYTNAAADNWGVNRNPTTGELSGYAWSETAGWINFGHGYGAYKAQLSPHPDNAKDYVLDGYAWSENVGWICFNYASIYRIVKRNAAPILNISDPLEYEMNEDQNPNNGWTIKNLLPDGSISDYDRDPQKDIAVTAVSNMIGKWQYATDGSNWQDFTSTTGTYVNLASNARLLDENHRIRFVPDENRYDELFGMLLKFRAWDEYSGTAGGTANASSGGGTATFSVEEATARLFVKPVNDLPVFTSSPLTTATVNELYTYNVAASDVENDHVALSAPTKPGWLTFTNSGQTVIDGPNLGIGIFNHPYGVAVDASGTVYVADAWNHRICKILTDGSITTLATGFKGPRGVAVDAAGVVYVADTENHRICKIKNGSVTALATGFNNPNGVAVNALGTRVYVADTGNHRICKIENGGVTTLASEFSNPTGVAVDASGMVYVADSGNNRVCKIENGNVTTLAGFGYPPYGVAVDAEGSVYVKVPWSYLYKIEQNGSVTQVVYALLGHGVAVGGEGIFHIAFPQYHSSYAPNGFIGKIIKRFVPAGSLYGIPSESDYANCPPDGYPVTLRADDNNNPVDDTEQSFFIQVVGGNTPPKFTSTPVITATEDQRYEYILYADDREIDLSTSAFFYVTKPGWLELLTFFDSGTWRKKLSGTPGDDDVGEHFVELGVKDGGGLITYQRFTISVANVNDAPTLNPAISLALPSIAEDEYPISNSGVSVATLIGTEGVLSDADGPGQGIAVTAVDNTHGVWQYSSDSGSTWTDFGAPSAMNARLLAADDRIRFAPRPNWNGAVSAGITFRAWDTSSGNAGSISDASSGGGTSAFSVASTSAGITVVAVNDPPLNTTVPDFSGTMTIGETLTATTSGAWNDNTDTDVSGSSSISYLYQWQRSDDESGTNLENITPAQAANTYTLTPADANKYLRVKVIAVDDGVGMPTNATAEAYSDYVGMANHAPQITTAGPISLNMVEGSGISDPISIAAVDADADILTWSVSAAPAHGAVSLFGAEGSYQPDLDYHGSDTFELQVSDGYGGTDTITINIEISPLNDAPVNTKAPQISGSPYVGETLTAKAGVWNDFRDTNWGGLSDINYSYQWQRADDADGTNLHAIGGATDETYTVTPADALKMLRLQVTATDSGVGEPATQSTLAYSAYLAVVARPPRIAQESVVVTMDEDGVPTGWSAPTLSAAADVPPLTWSLYSFPGQGTAEVNGSGSSPATCLYNPKADYHGTDSFIVLVRDGNDKFDLIEVEVTVREVADTPSVTNAVTDENTQTTDGLVISRHVKDGYEVSHFKISNIVNGTLYRHDGVTKIVEGEFITIEEGAAGLKFTPDIGENSLTHTFSFDVQASVSEADNGLGGEIVTAEITVNPGSGPGPGPGPGPIAIPEPATLLLLLTGLLSVITLVRRRRRRK